jgi:nicotinamide riboside kinase
MPQREPPPPGAKVIALIGAECTGKTTLAQELGEALAREGQTVAVVTEFLREFCDRQGRTPRREEQLAIAHEQMRRIERAAAAHEFVVADTTALMVAVYSEYLFDDRGLLAGALQAQSGYALTLLTAVDIGWQADGHQRDGAHVREPVDRLLRNALISAGLPFSVVCGSGPQRGASALAAIRTALLPQSDPASAASRPRWHWVCERCGDPQCEALLPLKT